MVLGCHVLEPGALPPRLQRDRGMSLHVSEQGGGSRAGASTLMLREGLACTWGWELGPGSPTQSSATGTQEAGPVPHAARETPLCPQAVGIAPFHYPPSIT